MRNKIVLLLFLLCSFTVAVNGQGRNEENRQHNHKFNYEQFKQKKAKYIKKEVGLTEDEAKAFLPLTDELMAKKFTLNKELRKAARALREKKDRTDDDFDSLVKQTLDVRIKEAQLEKEYYQKFKKVLSAEKIYKYQNAERKFVKEVVDKDK